MPQVLPVGSFAAVSTQVEAPVAHEVAPSLQVVGLVVQETPAVQATHAPALQTWFVPQTVPFGSLPASRQTELPVAQEVEPVRQKVGLVAQAWPATQVTQAPPLQTWSVPQTVPSGSLPASTQTELPVAQEVVPVRQKVGLVAQAWPATQATQTPALQTWSVPQPVPFAFGSGPSTQAGPLAQERTPCWQTPGFPAQASPESDLGAGVGSPSPLLPVPPVKPKGSKMKKWSCPCGVNVRVAIANFDATCNRCGGAFVLAG